MGREKRKARLNKGEASEFIGFGAFALPEITSTSTPVLTSSVIASAPNSGSGSGSGISTAKSTTKGLSLAPVYLGTESQLSLLFPRIGQKRDATTKTKALQELRDYFADSTILKKAQADALAHFLYLYQSKLHYDNTPRVRANSLECCHQAILQVPKAFATLVSQQPELIGMILCGRADPAADVRKAAQLAAQALAAIDSELTEIPIQGWITQGMWDYVQRILSYGKPMAMHQDLFQRKSQQHDAKLSDKQEEELDERFIRIIGTALGGLQIHIQLKSDETLPKAEEVKYLWRTLASPKAALRRKTYSLLSTCCQQASSLVDQSKLTNILTQNLASEKEPTNVKILLETLLAFIASVTPSERTTVLSQYTKALNKLFSKGCHGATQWAPTVLPIVAMLPTDDQPVVLTSIWQGKTNLVGAADQLDVVAAVAETATFLLLKQSHDLAEVIAKCWLQALETFVTRSIGNVMGGPVLQAYNHLGQTLAKDLQLLDTAKNSKQNSAMVLLDDWFWHQEIPKILLSESSIDLVQLTNLVRLFPILSQTPNDSHLPDLWKKLFHNYLEQCQASSGLVPGDEIYQFWMVLLERVSIDDLFADTTTSIETFLMNDLLRWMVIHTSSLSDQYNESLSKYDFHLFTQCRTTNQREQTWESFLRELVAAKCDLEALVSGLIIITKKEGLQFVRSTILDDLCRQIAKEAINELHAEEHEDSEDEFTDATELHLSYHRKAGDLLQTCVGLGEIDGLLVEDSVVSSWIDLACPIDPWTHRSPNPVLETLVSLVKENHFKTATHWERILLQSWRQGGDLWKDTSLPWMSKSESIRSSIITLASKELQSALRQASSEVDVDDHLSSQWSERAIHLFQLCTNTADTSAVLPLPSLEIVGLADGRLWDHTAISEKGFAASSLMNVMEHVGNLEVDELDYRWSLFANSKTIDPDQLLIQILLHLSDGTTDLLMADKARRRRDFSYILLSQLGGNSVSVDRLQCWIKSCLCTLSSLISVNDDEAVCRGVAVLSQLISLGFFRLHPTKGIGNQDKLQIDQIQEGDAAWYISDAKDSKLREPCTILKVHKDLPGDIYFTIKVESDDKVQEKQTVGDRLRSSSATLKNEGNEIEFIDEIDGPRMKLRQETLSFVMNGLVLPTWDKWQLYEFDIINILISQIGLLGARGIGTMHYTIFQKLLTMQSNLVGQLEAVNTSADFPTKHLWSLACALGYGTNTAASQCNSILIAFDPEATVKSLLNVLRDDEACEAKARLNAPSLEVVRATMAMLTVSIPALQESNYLEKVKSLLYMYVQKSLIEICQGGGFNKDDYMVLQAIDAAQGDHEVDTETDAVVALVGSFASRWENHVNALWVDLSLTTPVLNMILKNKPRIAGISGRKNADSLASALCVESKRWLALRFLEAYAKQGKPISGSPKGAMNKETATRLKVWSTSLATEEAEEFEEDVEIVCQWVPQRLMNYVECWQDVMNKDFHVQENDAFDRLTSWLAYLCIANVASEKDSMNRTALVSYTRKTGAVDSILDFAISYANVSTDRKVKFEKVDDIDALFSGSDALELSKLAWAVIFRTIEVFPNLSKNWWEMSCPNYFRDPVREFVESNVAPELLRRDLQRIKVTSSFGDMTVKGSLISREVTALYSQDDFTLTVVIKLPPSFPFRRAEVDCSKTLGVPEKRWKRWALQITQMLNNQGGSLTDALLLWKENVDKEFEGIEPCPVCYSVLHVKTHKLPEMQCKTCQNRFHFDCLTQWFRSSGKSACVICQQPWSGTRVS